MNGFLLLLLGITKWFNLLVAVGFGQHLLLQVRMQNFKILIELESFLHEECLLARRRFVFSYFPLIEKQKFFCKLFWNPLIKTSLFVSVYKLEKYFQLTKEKCCILICINHFLPFFHTSEQAIVRGIFMEPTCLSRWVVGLIRVLLQLTA